MIARSKLKFLILVCAPLLLFYNCKKEEIVPSIAYTCDFTDSSSKHPKNAQFKRIIEDYVKKGLPGISVLIKDSSGVWVGAAGYADINEGVKFNPCTISKACSITKIMVGSMTLKLVEQGILSLDDPIAKYIDQKILNKITNASGKTIRDLMKHSTGIFDVITSSDFYLAVINNPNKRWTQLELLEFVYGKEGEEISAKYPSNYSNTNTLLLSMCVEKATGETHDKLLRRMIIEPLGMNNTFYQGREDIPNKAAQGYLDLHNNGTLVNVSQFITGSGNGYGGVFSNVFDLYKFSKALFEDKTIVNSNSLNEMYAFNAEDEDFYCGVGTIKKFTTKGTYGIGHTGRDLGYNADMFYFPEKGRTMIFFVNYGTTGPSELKSVFNEFESVLCDAVLQ